MTVQLPGELASLLNELGYLWPMSDEDKLFELGQDWIRFGTSLTQVHEDASAVARQVWQDNTAGAVDAFQHAWEGDNAGAQVLLRGKTGAQGIGGALIVCATAVLALKVNVIVQLTILAAEIVEAIATSEVTFGASLLEIPAFKKVTDMAVNFLINKAVEAVLG